jgi:hypothetical protein
MIEGLKSFCGKCMIIISAFLKVWCIALLATWLLNYSVYAVFKIMEGLGMFK